MKKIIFFGGLMCFSLVASSKSLTKTTLNKVTTELTKANEEGENEVTLKLEKTSKVSIKIYDLQGNLVKTVKNDETFKAGEHHFHVSLKDFNLKHGSYFRKVSVDGKIRMVKMITI